MQKILTLKKIYRILQQKGAISLAKKVFFNYIHATI